MYTAYISNKTNSSELRLRRSKEQRLHYLNHTGLKIKGLTDSDFFQYPKRIPEF